MHNVQLRSSRVQLRTCVTKDAEEAKQNTFLRIIYFYCSQLAKFSHAYLFGWKYVMPYVKIDLKTRSQILCWSLMTHVDWLKTIQTTLVDWPSWSYSSHQRRQVRSTKLLSPRHYLKRILTDTLNKWEEKLRWRVSFMCQTAVDVAFTPADRLVFIQSSKVKDARHSGKWRHC